MDLHGQIMNLRMPTTIGLVETNPAIAYKLGHRDARHAAAELAAKADACIEALRALLRGNEYRSISGDSPAWHMKSMPRDADLDRAREALEALDGRVLVSG